MPEAVATATATGIPSQGVRLKRFHNITVT